MHKNVQSARGSFLKATPRFYYVLASCIGELGIIWGSDFDTKPLVEQILLPLPSMTIEQRILKNSSQVEKKESVYFSRLNDFLQHDLLSGYDTIETKIFDFSVYTDFEKKVLTALRRIPCGTTVSYGQFANSLGVPGGARAIGNVMKKNRFPIVFPCHRIIASSGELGGFSGGIELKRKLLLNEGIRFNVHGRIIK